MRMMYGMDMPAGFLRPHACLLIRRSSTESVMPLQRRAPNLKKASTPQHTDISQTEA